MKRKEGCCCQIVGLLLLDGGTAPVKHQTLGLLLLPDDGDDAAAVAR